MNKPSGWIAGTSRQKLSQMQSSLEMLFGGRWEDVFYPEGRAGGMDAMLLLLHMVCWQKRVLRRWFLNVATSAEVLMGVNPTGKGASRFEGTGFLGAPAVMVLAE